MNGARTLLQRVERWLHAPAPAERLAGLRIAIAGFVTIYLLANLREVSRMAGEPAAAFEPIGLARLLSEPLADGVLWTAFVAAVVVGVLFTAGAAVRITGPLFALSVLAWTSYHSSWGQLLHFEHLFTLHLLVLALAPTADAWSIDRWRSASTASSRPSVRYGWPIRLLGLATVVTYVLSGIAKVRLSGWDWFDPDTLANHIGYSATRQQLIGGLEPPLAEFALSAPWLLVMGAMAALTVELGAPIALAGGRLRNGWVVSAVAFHAATGLTMWVFFGYRGLAVGLLPFFAVETIPRRLRSLGSRRPAADEATTVGSTEPDSQLVK